MQRGVGIMVRLYIFIFIFITAYKDVISDGLYASQTIQQLKLFAVFFGTLWLQMTMLCYFLRDNVLVCK